jgi:hypothetical protein
MRHAASGQVHHCVLAEGASPNPPQVDNLPRKNAAIREETKM